MPNRRRDYVHRGDGTRRRERIRKYVIFLGFAGSVYVVASWRQKEARAESETWHLGFSSESQQLHEELDAAKGELELARSQLKRASDVMAFSSRYKVAADLAGSIYDIAQAEGIEPDLAFRLVNLESEFKERATSPVGALGLTQLMPETANFFQRGITRQQLYDRETNLRIGFRYLRVLIREQKGDVRRALTVYNRGPVAVNNAIARGENPANGYEGTVMKGYRGKGTVN